jgi:hypothetical protein
MAGSRKKTNSARTVNPSVDATPSALVKSVAEPTQPFDQLIRLIARLIAEEHLRGNRTDDSPSSTTKFSGEKRKKSESETPLKPRK